MPQEPHAAGVLDTDNKKMTVQFPDSDETRAQSPGPIPMVSYADNYPKVWLAGQDGSLVPRRFTLAKEDTVVVNAIKDWEDKIDDHQACEIKEGDPNLENLFKHLRDWTATREEPPAGGSYHGIYTLRKETLGRSPISPKPLSRLFKWRKAPYEDWNADPAEGPAPADPAGGPAPANKDEEMAALSLTRESQGQGDQTSREVHISNLYNTSLADALNSSSTSGSGYIDDVVAPSWGASVSEATKVMQAKMGEVERWGVEHGTVLEPSKSQLMVVVPMSKRRGWRKGKEVESEMEKMATVRIGGVEVPRVRAMRFLGCLVDDELSFKAFVGERVAKAMTVLNGVAALSSATKGVSLRHTRMLVRSCVLSQRDFLSTIWWSPSTGNSAALKAFDKVLRSVARFVSGGLRNSSLPALCFEAFLQPTVIRLESNAFRAALRFRTLESHPLTSVHLLSPPTLIAPTKENALTSHAALVDSAPTSSTFFYTDGSLVDGKAGAGVEARLKLEDGTLDRVGQESSVGSDPLERPRLAAAAHRHPRRQPGRCSQRVPCPPHARPAAPSVRRANPAVSIRLAWVPGHADVEGNEGADVQAKRGAETELEGETTEAAGEVGGREEEEEEATVDSTLARNLAKSASALRASFNDYLLERWATEWKASPVGKHLRRVDLHKPSPHILRLHDGLARPLSSLLTQLRSGHSFLNADLFRSKRSTTDRCLCGAREDLSHFFLACPRRILVESLGPLACNIPYLLSSSTAIPHTLRFVVSSGRFPRYHTNNLPTSGAKIGRAGVARAKVNPRTGNTVKKRKVVGRVG
ncbi:hypothetical protein JCM10212_006750 [Sporobolomyces blumeae]